MTARVEIGVGVLAVQVMSVLLHFYKKYVRSAVVRPLRCPAGRTINGSVRECSANALGDGRHT